MICNRALGGCENNREATAIGLAVELPNPGEWCIPLQVRYCAATFLQS